MHFSTNERTDFTTNRAPGLPKQRDNDLRPSGIEIIGSVKWGTHFCQFYQTKTDLLETLVPYFKAGLENNEFCMWVTSEPLQVDEAKHALQKAVPNFAEYEQRGQVEIIPYSAWYTIGGNFDQSRVLHGWVQKLKNALDKGYAGLRLTGNTFWLEKKDWQGFMEYERTVDTVIGSYTMLAVCTYSLEKCGVSEILDVAARHKFTLIKRGNSWQSFESSLHGKTEAALVETRNYLESLIDYANAPIIVWNPDYAITRFNHAFEKMTGYLASEVLGKKLNILFPNDSAEESMKKIQRTTTGEYWKTVEIPIRQKNEKIRIALWNSANIHDRDGKSIVSTIAQGQDITERILAEEKIRRHAEELRTANEELTHFNRLMVGRELRMIELKQEINALCRQLGQSPRYTNPKHTP